MPPLRYAGPPRRPGQRPREPGHVLVPALSDLILLSHDRPPVPGLTSAPNAPVPGEDRAPGRPWSSSGVAGAEADQPGDDRDRGVPGQYREPAPGGELVRSGSGGLAH